MATKGVLNFHFIYRLLFKMSLSVLFSVVRFARNALDNVTDFAYGYVYDGKHRPLPPIKDDCILMPAHELARKIRQKEISCVDVVKAYIRRIRDVQPIVNCVVDERFVEAVEAATRVDERVREAEEEEIERETPLLGVPVTIKEAIAVKGCLFTVGLPARRGHRAQADADVTSLLRGAGAIPLAVTMTPELCFWWESYNTLYGVCRNPYDTCRTAGGSSGAGEVFAKMYKKGWSHDRCIKEPIKELSLGHSVSFAKQKDIKSLLKILYGEEWEKDESISWYKQVLNNKAGIKEQPEEENDTNLCDCLEEDYGVHV